MMMMMMMLHFTNVTRDFRGVKTENLKDLTPLWWPPVNHKEATPLF